MFFSFIESRDGASNSEVNQKHSDNWKETKRKRKETEDHKSKRRKQVEGTESELKSRVSRNLTAPVSGGKQADAAQATHFGKNKNQKPDIMIEDNEYLSEPNALSGKSVFPVWFSLSLHSGNMSAFHCDEKILSCLNILLDLSNGNAQDIKKMDNA